MLIPHLVRETHAGTAAGHVDHACFRGFPHGCYKPQVKAPPAWTFVRLVSIGRVHLDEYMAHDATGLAELVAGGDVTPGELLAVARARAAEVNPALNAIVARIREADRRANGPLAGPFAGVPFLIKDLQQEYAGYPTSSGSRALAADVATEHSLYTRRLLDAGLVVFGKTNTPEFGAKAVTEPEFWGPTRNPWNLGHTPGGSSGGSAAAVAAGIVPAAGANDGGGSIRIPAACNGLVGLKPSRGLMPYGPQSGEPMFGFVTQGVLSRTVRDTAGLCDVLVGTDPAAEYSGERPRESFTAQITRPPQPLRIGYSSWSALTPHPHPEAIAAVEDAAKLLAELGHHVEEARPDYDDAALGRDFLTVWFAQLHGEVSAAKQRLGARDRDFEADTLVVAELGRSAGVGALFAALDERATYVRALAEFHEGWDCYLTPMLAKPPLPVGALATPPTLQRVSRAMSKAHGGRIVAATGIVDDLVRANLGWVPYTQLANVTGRPAINVPLHWTADGLPLGVQFVGALGSDGLLLRLAAQLEQARPWAGRHPARVASAK